MSYKKKNVLYSSGDSTIWGAELNNRAVERFSALMCEELGWADCNNASAGVSNDYMYRQTLRDVSHWLKHKEIWSEESGWVKADNIFVLIGWTAPTRFEWWDGSTYQQERLWMDYDKWGYSDGDKMTDALFAINQTMDIPSYIKTFNQIISLSSVLEKHKIPHYFFNSFYEYKIPNEPIQKIDKFGKPEFQTGLNVLWDELPQSIKNETMFSYIKRNGGDFLPRKHPSAKSHKMWAEWLIKNVIQNEGR